MGHNTGIGFIDDPLNDVGDATNDIIDSTKKGAKNLYEEANQAGRDIGNWYGGGQFREVAKGVGEITGRNAYERQLRDASERQEAESNRLLWERNNSIAQNKEMDLQAEARKRMKAAQAGGRAGTILTGASGDSQALGAGGGNDVLGT